MIATYWLQFDSASNLCIYGVPSNVHASYGYKVVVFRGTTLADEEAHALLSTSYLRRKDVDNH